MANPRKNTTFGVLGGLWDGTQRSETLLFFFYVYSFWIMGWDLMMTE